MSKTWEELIEEFKTEKLTPDEVNKRVRGYEIISTIINNLDELQKK